MGWEEIGVIAVIAVLLIGPERLPGYAEQLARLVRTLRDFARGATETIKEELGPEGADLDFSKLDPRQYDPRRIVREALKDDLTATKQAFSSTAAAVAAAAPTASGANGATVKPSSTAVKDDAAAENFSAIGPGSASEPAVHPLAHGAPFDDEAT